MNSNVPEGTEPLYTPYKPGYKGLAMGGPNDGKPMISETLTAFVKREVTRKTPDPNTMNLRGLTVEQRNEIATAEKAQMREAIWARQNPHRYDFDIDRQVWVYVEYTLSPLEES